MTARLNGTLLGTMALAAGWQDNELDLSFSSAVSPSEAGTGSDTRRLSLAVDRLAVRGR